MSFLRRQESRKAEKDWIPAYAGMTKSKRQNERFVLRGLLHPTAFKLLFVDSAENIFLDDFVGIFGQFAGVDHSGFELFAGLAS